MERCRIIFSGSGGQGLITAAIILAEAAVLHEGLNAVQSQSYGPEARGGASRSDVIIADTDIRLIRPGGLLLTDSHYVKEKRKTDARQVELPMYKTVMDKIGRPIVFNMCMLGALIGLMQLVKVDSIIKVFESRLPGGFLDLNKKALNLGLELAKNPESQARLI